MIERDVFFPSAHWWISGKSKYVFSLLSMLRKWMCDVKKDSFLSLEPRKQYYIAFYIGSKSCVGA